MTGRYWFLSVGPFDADQAIDWAEALRGQSRGTPEVELVDHRQWYARAMDPETVRSVLAALRVGMLDDAVPEVARLSITGVTSDMETWLDRELDAD